MSISSENVEVTLVDDRSDAVMGVVMLASENLPESFFASTTLHVGDEDWSVVSAEPMTRGEYTASGRLRIRLRPIALLNPQDILYSLPTICDAFPASNGADADGTEVTLSEDDWRQCELVSDVFADVVERELTAIRGIYERERVGPGFRKLHPRRGIPSPIVSGRILPSQLSELIGDRPRRPVRFRNAGHRASDVIAVSLDDQQIVYAVVGSSDVRVIGVHPVLSAALTNLKAFAARHGLIGVDWCRCTAIRPDDPSFDSLLGAAS